MSQIIPLTTAPNQTFTVSLSVDGATVDLGMILRYNEVARYWVLSIYDTIGALLLDSLPLITGSFPAGNILGQFAYLEIGSAYVINASQVASPDFPNNGDLGTDFVLLWDNTPDA